MLSHWFWDKISCSAYLSGVTGSLHCSHTSSAMLVAKTWLIHSSTQSFLSSTTCFSFNHFCCPFLDLCFSYFLEVGWPLLYILVLNDVVFLFHIFYILICFLSSDVREMKYVMKWSSLFTILPGFFSWVYNISVGSDLAKYLSICLNVSTNINYYSHKVLFVFTAGP